MTVSSTTARVSYSGNGTTTAFAVPFYFLANSQLLVVLRSAAGIETTQTLTTNYTVTGAGVSTGGTVTMLVAPASGTTLTISRNVALTQETDFLPNDKLPAESLEQTVDKLTMITQELDERLDRSIKFPVSDATSLNPVVASSALRAGKFLGFDSFGNVTVSTATPGSSSSADVSFLQGGTGAVIRTVQSKLRDFVDVKDFGAVGIADGGLDDTDAIQKAIDYAASVGKGIFLGGAYKVNYLTIKNGLSFFSSGTLVKVGLVSSNGLLVVNSDVRYCEISDIEMDLGGIMNRGIFCNGAQFCTFDNNRIYNFTTPYNAAIPAEGIRLAQNSKYIYVSNNYISMPIDTAGSYPVAIGVYVTSNCSTPLGNFENGSFIQPTNLAEKNKIFGNTILNGAYAISLFGGMENEIYDNYMDGQSTRGIHLVPTASRNFIHGNKIYNFGSTAIVTAYGCNSNVITNNYCYAPNSTGEGGIVVYVGASGTVINSNFIFCASQYGIYTAVNVNNIIISDNTIVAAFNTEAGIAVESDWVSPLPAGADYSKPAYAAPPSPRTNWASDNATYITIKNNVINEPKSTIAGIYVAQIGAAADCVGVRNENNTITTTSPTYHVYYFQHGSGGKVLSNQVLSDLRTSDQNVAKIYLAGNRNKFAICSGNSIINDAAINLAAGTTTPDVSIGYVFQHNDTSPTSVTNYVNGVDGQEIRVRLSSNTTIVHDVNKIRLKGSVNAVGTSTNEFMALRNSGGVWIELSRSF